MTEALTEAPAVIGATPPASDGRAPADLSKSVGDGYIYLRFKPGDGQPTTYVRVKAGKNVRVEAA
jgi:hypothetical protein